MTQANRPYSDDALHGTSENMREVRDLIRRVADTDVTVLIRGESGTGKNLVARAIHEASPRKERPFVKINCAALPSELLESELFGFERGAFTGAIQRKPGKFEFAHRGTMFLDEISEMHLALQSKLLQVLQDGEFSRLGGEDDMHVDVRVVSATNRDLESAVANGEFREDLYFRLNVVCITLPPLRQRRDEILELANLFVERSSKHYNKPPLTLGDATRRLMEQYRLAGERAGAREPDQAGGRPGFRRIADAGSLRAARAAPGANRLHSAAQPIDSTCRSARAGTCTRAGTCARGVIRAASSGIGVVERHRPPGGT